MELTSSFILLLKFFAKFLPIFTTYIIPLDSFLLSGTDILVHSFVEIFCKIFSNFRYVYHSTRFFPFKWNGYFGFSFSSSNFSSRNYGCESSAAGSVCSFVKRSKNKSVGSSSNSSSIAWISGNSSNDFKPK